MVVSARQEASAMGRYYEKEEMLWRDGTQLALAVSYPQAGNIGGGGFMVFRTTNGETGARLSRKHLLPQLKTCISIQKEMWLKEKYRLISSLRNSWYTGRIIPST
jgi:gamma-glutamyltranspeptidase/glutathione hydrolase